MLVAAQCNRLDQVAAAHELVNLRLAWIFENVHVAIASELLLLSGELAVARVAEGSNRLVAFHGN